MTSASSLMEFLLSGADVVYDPEVAVSLVKLLSKILSCSSTAVQPEILICSTVRNPETYSGFKQQLGKNPQRKFKGHQQRLLSVFTIYVAPFYVFLFHLVNTLNGLDLLSKVKWLLSQLCFNNRFLTVCFDGWRRSKCSTPPFW